MWKGRDAIGDQVVDDAAALVREQRVLRLAVTELREVVREEALQELELGRAFDVDLAHVRDVEDAAVAPDGEMLGDHALVLDGHVPACERHHPRAEGDVAIVQRGASKSLFAHEATLDVLER